MHASDAVSTVSALTSRLSIAAYPSAVLAKSHDHRVRCALCSAPSRTEAQAGSVLCPSSSRRRPTASTAARCSGPASTPQNDSVWMATRSLPGSLSTASVYGRSGRAT